MDLRVTLSEVSVIYVPSFICQKKTKERREHIAELAMTVAIQNGIWKIWKIWNKEEWMVLPEPSIPY
jgi:hypothetical protein